jgi:hypothetical protein
MVRRKTPEVKPLIMGRDPREPGEIADHGAHLGIGTPVDGDSIYDGMYHNALGVAVIIEAARILVALQLLIPP